jgi:peptidyl-tRNA hydrolase, PTH1 family
MSTPWLFAGLGNSGRSFRENRHNVGFMVADQAAVRWGLDFSRVQFRALVADGRVGSDRILVGKPQTMMNLSGQAVGGLVHFYKIPLQQMVVIFDDLDLPVGSLRLRPAGGSGGHRGMESIIATLGSEDFPRLRVGIGRPPGSMDPAAYVLQDFGRGEAKVVGPALARAVDCLEVVLNQGLEAAMTRFNGATEADP